MVSINPVLEVRVDMVMENTVNMVDTAEMLQKTTNRTGEKI